MNPYDVAFALKRGTKFFHRRWLDENNHALICEVTKIALGCVYWKQPGERKAKQYFQLKDAAKYVGSIIS